MERQRGETGSFRIQRDVVLGCIDEEQPTDRLFRRAWSQSLTVLTRRQKAAIAPVTGHIAESVVQLILQDDCGYNVVWLLDGPGTRGVDLIVLPPAGDKVIAVEVKGTLRRNHWPKVSGRLLKQMTQEWLDKPDNPGMGEWGLTSLDLYGGLIQVNFAEMAFRVCFTADFHTWTHVTARHQLHDLAWLAEEPGGACYFEPRGTPLTDCMPKADHYPSSR